mmetsp:Transcript_10468/g.14024  ORF Transcript_10468/g.14024 Transcript_10468/m.14024 type:complete len:142 (+) Transcript_10468:58-483(+)|eukprot:CAMPEP_0201483822 /NCGR_PEP_ID=MMETSP0151_2-20130828/8012_1 /ASSEMBLY_ACC=CAM_ASM_000257 /TAXON_ID=200890 /ORGANISM="Paramoeba atlantica, Strain 621/1 / CCAP 1560/9" /LENGTH=141 /DNA_ID=CAMNT_0047867151 /DNA_START=73 /DNA_END=498 /DNA_ORIENTATION=+
MSDKVQTFGKKKTSVACATAFRGHGQIRVNGQPLHLVQPAPLRQKLFEPLHIIGAARARDIDIRIRVRGGGQVSQVYATRQAISKALVAYYQKHHSELEKQEVKEALLHFDRSLLVADPRRREPKKYGCHGARSKFTKSYR